MGKDGRADYEKFIQFLQCPLNMTATGTSQLFKGKGGLDNVTAEGHYNSLREREG